MTRLERMRLGRRAAYLRRCILCAELLDKYENQTSVRKRVFDIHIRPILRCSYTTFNNMLNELDPHKQLESIENKLLSN